jgi:hypothetical protein
MVIFNSYVKLPEGSPIELLIYPQDFHIESARIPASLLGPEKPGLFGDQGVSKATFGLDPLKNHHHGDSGSPRYPKILPKKTFPKLQIQ